ncbi:3-hydroxyanthranilate 3,4-dioxygenase [Phyllosticta citriasiana]|uniref:3-hydroxyanthranilate 3,4-dioxygenase n=1 Tax=Phyllosticta citriasiana TaxID=595635 RepID=UPI0030FD808A
MAAAAAAVKAAQPQSASFSSTGARKQEPQRQAEALSNPINLPKWLEANSHLLKPPVNNYCVWNSSATVMIVGGPNARTDYHINSTPEYFYQYKGRMLLKVVDQNPDTPDLPPQFRDVYIDEGEMFLLPPNVPHNPVRFADTVGVVLEQKRPEGSVDRLRWYCQGCGSQVHEKSFHCTNLGTQIKEAVESFKADTEARTCKKCGELCDVAPRKSR